MQTKINKLRPICEHIDYDNQRDCEEEADWMCMCCASPTCYEHKGRDCRFGGMGFIEIE